MLAGAVVVFDNADTTGDAEPLPAMGRDSILLYDADDHGAVYTRGTEMIGATAAGKVLWRHRMRADDVLPYAVCLERCPAAVLGFGRSGRIPPDRPDGPRVVFRGPGWRAATSRAGLRVDRPLLPAPKPLRLVMQAAGRAASLTVSGRSRFQVSTPEVVPILAADRETALLLEPRSPTGSAYILRRRGAGWAVGRHVALGRSQSACLSPDGQSAGVVGHGPPRRIRLADASLRPRAIRSAGRGEDEAGVCALDGDVMASAVVRSGSGGNDTQVSIHGGKARVRLRLRGPAPSGIWVSSRSGRTAILHDSSMLLVGPEGREERWPRVRAAGPAGPGRLRVIGEDGRLRVRKF